MTRNQFVPSSTPLLPGINLIEASAGTGKTFAIAMLALRLVVEKGFDIEQLLIVTFTRAATEELKDRIRRRIYEARQIVNGFDEAADDAISSWINTLKLEPETVRKRLDLALMNIDRAGIFTIHGFCQRVLKEHAMESGQLFDAELTGDLAMIKQACADDFWRKQLYPRSRWDVSALTAKYKTPDQLLASVDWVPLGVDIFPEAIDLDQALADFREAADQAKLHFASTLILLRDGLSSGKFKPAFSAEFGRLADELGSWLQGLEDKLPSIQALALLTQNNLFEGLNGNQFRTAKGQTPEQRKRGYLADLGVDSRPFDELNNACSRIALSMRRNLLVFLQQEIVQRLQQLNAMSFDDLIIRLSQALRDANGELLAMALKQKFQAVLIDEFQDTDAGQWHIFSSVFAEPSHFLYLIGDPKQAIYRFRGADIYAYLSAQEQAQHCFTLTHNWRSHPLLVSAVNRLFSKERVFRLDNVEFQCVRPGRSDAEGKIVHAGEDSAPLVLWQLPPMDSKSGFWTAGKAAEQIKYAVANEIVSLLRGDYTVLPEQRKLQAKDIAVLVRTNTQARDYQALLLAAGVPTIINSNESVFATQEALDLHTLLQAVAHPGDVSLLKQALALTWFGLDGQALYRLSIDENLFDPWLSRFAGYYQHWLQQGVMAMMLKLLSIEGVGAQLSRAPMAERRLTNLHHVLELAQQEARETHLGIEKTLDWLSREIIAAREHAIGIEDSQLRLESDENAVQVITQHRAKGLEFPIVFCPLLWQHGNHFDKNNPIVLCHEQGRMIADLGSDQFELRRQQAMAEERAEDLRIAYVALTRAQYRCYLVWADARSESKPNESALAWLLDLGSNTFEEQQELLQSLQRSDPDVFAYRLLDQTDSLDRLESIPVPVETLGARELHRSLYSPWQMSSYTALSALSQHDAPELPPDKTDEIQSGDQVLSSDLPRGAQTGNVVHELLELHAFSDLAAGKDISAHRDQLCRRYGVILERPETIDELLKSVVSTPLSSKDPGFSLMYLNERHCMKEMPFYLALKSLDASRINQILDNSSAFQPLSSKALSGYLTGFIDLIAEYQGRYYVLDYKTNDLDNYSLQRMTDAMREHNYGLQYWLYTVVLHRYLQLRLPDYRYDRHVGGVCYLFVRGMRPEIASSGVYFDLPDPDRVEALAMLFES